MISYISEYYTPQNDSPSNPNSKDSSCVPCYDLAAYRWLPIAAPVMLEPTQDANVVWMGEEMIVAGSTNIQDKSGFEMAAYNPVNDTWCPLEKTEHDGQWINRSILWTGTDLIVWGGRYRDAYSNAGASYRPFPPQP